MNDSRKQAHTATGVMGVDKEADEMGVMSFVFAGIDTIKPN
jgi:hypothetical protein